MVERDTTEYNDNTPFDSSKLQDLQTISAAIRHKMYGADVREPIAQLPDALIKALQDGTDLGETGALAELVAARGGFETVGLHEAAQDNGIQTNAAAIVNASSSVTYAVNLAKQAASGSPRGTFSSESKLKAAYPSGASGIYVTTDNGHWWFYSDGWIDGGAYQATEIANNSINQWKLMPRATSAFVYSGIAPNFDTQKQQLLLNGNTNIVFGGSRLVSLDAFPYTLDLTGNGFIFVDIDNKMLRFGRLPANDIDSLVVIGGRIGSNYWLNGNYSVDGLGGSSAFKSPYYALYSSEGGVEWDTDNRTVKFNNIFMNFGGFSNKSDNVKVSYTADVNFIYYDMRNKTFRIKAAPLDSKGNGFVLGWLKHSTKEISLNIPDSQLHVLPLERKPVFGADSFIALGDSITYGLHASDQATRNYVYLAAQKLGVDGYNEGISSSTIQNGSEDDSVSFLNRSKTIDFTRANTILIFGGTNDFAQALPIGEIDDDVENTLCGALNNVINNIYNGNSKAKILMVTPAWRARINDPNDPVDIEKTPNSEGLYLKDYAKAVINVAEKYHLPVLDLYHEFNVNELNYKTWLADGLHPNDDGYEKLSFIIAKFLISN